MEWYVLQVMTAHEKDVCGALRRKGIEARAPEEKVLLRRRGAWHEEQRLLLPGYVFVGVEYSAALYHIVAPVQGVIRWLGLEAGRPQALAEVDVVRWGLASAEVLGLSTVLFAPGGWRVTDGPLLQFAGRIVHMDRRQRRATVLADILGTQRRLRFSIIAQEATTL